VSVCAERQNGNKERKTNFFKEKNFVFLLEANIDMYLIKRFSLNYIIMGSQIKQ